MEDRQNLMTKLGEISTFTQHNIERRLDYYKLEIIERIATSASTMITAFSLMLICSTVLIMLSLALAFFLSQLWNSYALGFLAISGIYALLAIFVIVFRRRLITNPVLNFIIKSFVN
jgi:membrane protein YdbS with pleckstrin-like domain